MALDAKVLERLKKVQVMAERGGSEGEIAAAAAILQDLMEKYNVTSEQLEGDVKKLFEDIIGYYAWERGHGSVELGPVTNVLVWIARFCEVECYGDWVQDATTKRGWSKCVHFVGTPTDTLAAKYLTGIVASAFKFEWDKWRSGNRAHIQNMQRSKKTFELAMAQRIIERLKALVASRQGTQEKVALVQNKMGAITKWLKDFRNLNLHHRQTRKRSMRSIDGNAYLGGQQAGNNVRLTKTKGLPA